MNRTDGLRRLAATSLALAWGALATGCGNTLDCALKGDNIRGRITFAPAIAIRPESRIVVEWSTDSFSGATRAGFTTLNNLHGLPSVAYSLCATDGATYQFRVFQDLDGDSTLDAGESSGRDDGTADGNAAYVSRLLRKSTENTWETIDDVNITVDTP